MAKCTAEWKVSDEISFVDMGNYFTLIKLTYEVDATEFLMVTISLWVDKFLVYRGGRTTLTLSKTACFGLVMGSDSPSFFRGWSESTLEKNFKPIGKFIKLI